MSELAKTPSVWIKLDLWILCPEGLYCVISSSYVFILICVKTSVRVSDAWRHRSHSHGGWGWSHCVWLDLPPEFSQVQGLGTRLTVGHQSDCWPPGGGVPAACWVAVVYLGIECTVRQGNLGNGVKEFMMIFTCFHSHFFWVLASERCYIYWWLSARFACYL